MGNGSGVLQKPMKPVDPFHPPSSTLITSRLREAAIMFETSPHFRAIFVEYLQTGVWIDTFIRKNFNFSHLDNNIFTKLAFLEDIVPESINNNECPVSVAEILECSERLQAIIVAAALPVFLEAPEFQAMFAPVSQESGLLSFFLSQKHIPAYRFRGKSCDETHATSEGDACDPVKDSDSVTVVSTDNSARLSIASDSERSSKHQSNYVLSEDNRHISIQSSHKEESRTRFRLLMMRSLAVMDSLELDRMLAQASTSWLGELLIFVETLPIAVIAASCFPQQNTRVFYCNRKFENISGFSRQETVGQSCTYGMQLPTDRQSTTEIHQILRRALSSVPSTTASVSTSVAAVSPTSSTVSFFNSSTGDMNQHISSTCDVIVQHSQKPEGMFASCSRIKSISSRPFKCCKVDLKTSPESAQYVLIVHDDIARLKKLLSNNIRPKQTLTEEMYAINHVMNLLPAMFCS